MNEVFDIINKEHNNPVTLEKCWQLINKHEPEFMKKADPYLMAYRIFNYYELGRKKITGYDDSKIEFEEIRKFAECKYNSKFDNIRLPSTWIRVYFNQLDVLKKGDLIRNDKGTYYIFDKFENDEIFVKIHIQDYEEAVLIKSEIDNGGKLESFGFCLDQIKGRYEKFYLADFDIEFPELIYCAKCNQIISYKGIQRSHSKCTSCGDIICENCVGNADNDCNYCAKNVDTQVNKIQKAINKLDKLNVENYNDKKIEGLKDQFRPVLTSGISLLTKQVRDFINSRMSRFTGWDTPLNKALEGFEDQYTVKIRFGVSVSAEILVHSTDKKLGAFCITVDLNTGTVSDDLRGINHLDGRSKVIAFNILTAITNAVYVESKLNINNKLLNVCDELFTMLFALNF